FMHLSAGRFHPAFLYTAVHAWKIDNATGSRWSTATPCSLHLDKGAAHRHFFRIGIGRKGGHFEIASPTWNSHIVKGDAQYGAIELFGPFHVIDIDIEPADCIWILIHCSTILVLVNKLVWHLPLP